jgi:ribosome-binding factor A
MSYKRDRMVDQIQTLLSTLLLLEVSDPRLQGLTVTKVTLDPEYVVANIWVNALGDEERSDEVMAGLASAKGFLRRELGRRIHLRNTPDLVFHWDYSLERGETMQRILDELDIPEEPADDDPVD